MKHALYIEGIASYIWVLTVKHFVFQHANLVYTFMKLVKWFCSKEKCFRHGEYLRYLHNTNTIAFTIASAIEQDKFL